MGWFVYLNAPVSRLTAVIDLTRAVVGSPDEVTAVMERMRPGNGASVLEYVRDLDRAFAIQASARAVFDATRLWQRDMYEHYQLSGGHRRRRPCRSGGW